MTDDRDDVVKLPPEVSDAHLSPRPPPSKHRRGHGLLIGATTASFTVAVVSILAFVTVQWPGRTGRILVGVFLFSILIFFACASAAIFTAARATHARPRGTRAP